MEQEICDVCGQPATHFFTAAQCFSDGRPGSSAGTQLCDVHAAAHEQAAAQETLDSMLRSWRGLATFAQPTDIVEIVFDAQGEADAAQSAAELRQICGGDAPIAECPGGWKIIWRLAASVSAIDQWQCEGWSRRVMEIVRRGKCKLNGFAMPPQRPSAAQGR